MAQVRIYCRDQKKLRIDLLSLGLSTGSIYLFSISEDQDGEVTVSRQATIIPEEGSCGYFGKSLQLRNDRLIIGAPGRILEEYVSFNASVSECGT